MHSIKIIKIEAKKIQIIYNNIISRKIEFNLYRHNHNNSDTKKKLNATSVKRTSGTHDKPHILEIRSAFFDCASTAPNYRVRNYKFCKNCIQVFYTNFEEP